MLMLKGSSYHVLGLFFLFQLNEEFTTSIKTNVNILEGLDAGMDLGF